MDTSFAILPESRTVGVTDSVPLVVGGPTATESSDGGTWRGIESIVDALRTAIGEHHVVVLRRQHLSAEQHATLARAFGPIQASPVQLAAGRHGAAGPVSTIEDTAARPPAGFPWHTDVSWTSEPPGLGFLSAVVIPEFGGDTIWASTAAIYDALPSEVQRLCAASTVLHAPDASLLASVERHHGPEAASRLRRPTSEPLCAPVQPVAEPSQPSAGTYARWTLSGDRNSRRDRSCTTWRCQAPRGTMHASPLCSVMIRSVDSSSGSSRSRTSVAPLIR